MSEPSTRMVRNPVGIPVQTRTTGLSVATAATAQASTAQDESFAHWVQLAETPEEIVAIAEAYEVEHGVDCTVSDFQFHEIQSDPELGRPGDTYWSADIICFK